MLLHSLKSSYRLSEVEKTVLMTFLSNLQHVKTFDPEHAIHLHVFGMLFNNGGHSQSAANENPVRSAKIINRKLN